MKISGQIMDVVGRRIFPGVVTIENGMVADIVEKPNNETRIIMPGFVDSHIHIESSMLVPSEFARIAVTHGSVGAVCDPHEIANVLGINGVRFMIDNGKRVPFKFHFGAPSCVPATTFETSGAVLDHNDIETLMAMDDIYFLGEMMNYPGVIFNDEEVHLKLEAAKRHNKPIDGHAPGVTGEDAKKYASAGITTDHECFTLEEALEKIKLGMKILIREGSAAKNFDALVPLFNICPDKIMFCTDDCHPDDLVKYHINRSVKRAISLGYDKFDVIRAATVAPVEHYKMNIGLLQKNDPADFIVIDNFENFNVLQTYINGELVAENGESRLGHIATVPINNFDAEPVTAKDFYVEDNGKKVNAIEVIPGQLVTNRIVADRHDTDILKIAVINRYKKSKPAIGYIKGFGLKRGALASSIAHDSHNIVVVGCSDEEMAGAVNQIVMCKGGITAYSKEVCTTMPMPVAGLMNNGDGYIVAEAYKDVDAFAKRLGTTLNAPFMTMAFMALLVIPSLKLSDKGLFDGEKFRFEKLLAE